MFPNPNIPVFQMCKSQGCLLRAGHTSEHLLMYKKGRIFLQSNQNNYVNIWHLMRFLPYPWEWYAVIGTSGACLTPPVLP